MAKFLSFMLVLVGLAAAAALYSQHMGSVPWRAATPIQPPRPVSWLDNLYSKNPREEEAAKKEVRSLGDKALPAIRAVLADPALRPRTAEGSTESVRGARAQRGSPRHPRSHGEPHRPCGDRRGGDGPELHGQRRVRARSREGFTNDDPVVRRESLRSIGKLKSLERL